MLTHPVLRLVLGGARVYLVAVTGIALICIATGIGWVGTTFPGFFVMPNRVVPSVGLGHWTGTANHRIFQHAVDAVDGRAVASTDTIYATVAAAPPGRTFRYDFRGSGRSEPSSIASMPFGWRDLVAMFGPLIANGVVFSAIGAVVWILGAGTPAALGATLFAIDVGLFCLTALDLYGPGTFFRLHVATEAWMPVTLLHLMLVFPVVRLGTRRRLALAGLHGAGALLVVAYEWWLYEPVPYTRIHNLCMAAAGVGGVAMTLSCLHAYATSTSVLVRRRLAVVGLGLVCGFALPAWVMLASVFQGGERAINLAAFTASAFPVALAYAVVKHDLFEIDALLRRGLSYVVLTSIVVGLYGTLALGGGLVLRRLDLEHSPLFPLAFTAAMILVFQPLRTRTQLAIDRMYARSRYDPRATLERASADLAATLDLDDICRLTLGTILETFSLTHGSVWLRSGERYEVAKARGVGSLSLPADHALVRRLHTAARGVSVHHFAEGVRDEPEARSCARTLALLQADLVLPIGGSELLGFVALGPKPSRALFTLEDVGFLMTFLNQVGVAVRNARAYRQIEELNRDLECRVADRTVELANANGRLAESVRQIESAYHDLQRSQESLMRSERLATLGQLTAGIAHEVNTPLGAALNTLAIAHELAGEYAASIGDATVNDDDHRAIAGELRTRLDDVHRWTGMAAAFVRTIKNHTHGAEQGHVGPFDVKTTLMDVELLLAHRLRLSSCTLAIACPADLTLHGDGGKLGQVVTNLVTNAIDAYDEAGGDGGVIDVRVDADERAIRLTIADAGCGIPADRLPRIFDALYTTKPRGKGTGLGLSLSRQIVERDFAGTIEVASAAGTGSRFTVHFPRTAAHADATAA